MREYYKLLRQLAPNPRDDIEEIMRDLLAETHPLPDSMSSLFAEWVFYYRPLFTHLFAKHPELKEYYSDIINDTFLSVIKNFDRSRIQQSVINKYVVVTVKNRMKKYFSVVGSTKLQKSRGKIQVVPKQPSELPPLAIYDLINSPTYDCPDLRIDLERAVSSHPLGREVLGILLQSKRQIGMQEVVSRVLETHPDLSDQDKIQLKDIYRNIGFLILCYQED